MERNFSDAEIAYCRAQPSPQSSFAARWAGKEAVFKSLAVKSQGAGAAMKDIEILNDEATGAPVVHLHGEAKNQAVAKGISRVLISLSHSEVSFMKLNKAPMTNVQLRPLPLHSPKPRNLPDRCPSSVVFFTCRIVAVLHTVDPQAS